MARHPEDLIDNGRNPSATAMKPVAPLPLISLDNPCLHRPATEVPDAAFGSGEALEIAGLVNATFDDLFKRRVGVGLAAPQVGLSFRVLAAEDFGKTAQSPVWHAEVERVPFDRVVMCNPVLVESSLQQQIAWETCLSQPQVIGLVARPQRITVTYRDLKGASRQITATGWQARILCHEIDHLAGCLCSRHYLGISGLEMPVYTEQWRERSLVQAMVALLPGEPETRR